MGKQIRIVLKDFPESLTSILFVIPKVTVIYSTMFKSPKLSSVTSLTIANSGIMQIEPGAFSAFQNLSKLSLYHNNLTTVLASWFSNPGHLENLTISLNRIKEVGPYMLSSFSSLTTLNMANNRIHMIAVESLRNLSKLKFLDLSGNNLSVLKRDIFSGFRFPSMKLGHNPWNCSCELQDFGAFLQELLNASLLEDASSVTCHSPVTLKGFPVWNISDFGCQPTFLPASLGNVLDKTIVPVTLVCVVLFVLLWMLLVLWKLKHNRVNGQPGKGMSVGTFRKERMRPWKSRGNSNRKRQVTIEEMTSQITVVEQSSRSALASLSSSEHSGGNLEPSRLTGKSAQLVLNGVDSASLNSFHHHSKLRAPALWASMELSCENTFCMPEPVKQDLSISEMSSIDDGDAWVENSKALEYFTVSVKSSYPKIILHGMVQSTTPKPFLLKRSQTWPQESSAWIKESCPRTHILTIPVKDSQDEVKDTEIYKNKQGDLHMQDNPKLPSKKTSKPMFTQKLALLGRYQRREELGHRLRKVRKDGASAQLSLRPEISPVSFLEDDKSFDKSCAVVGDLLLEVVENHGRWTREHWKKTHQPKGIGKITEVSTPSSLIR